MLNAKMLNPMMLEVKRRRKRS